MPAVTASAVVVDDSALRAKLKGIGKEIPFALKTAINDTMWDAIKEERAEMASVFDRPTPIVLRGLRVAKKATKQDPRGAIWFKDVFGRFGELIENTLRPHIEGGQRKAKSTERRLREIGVLRGDEWLIPASGARLNRYGNVSGAQHVKVLSYFRAFREAGYAANRAGGSSTTGGMRYFINRAGRGRGIFQVRGRRGKPKLIFYITRQAPRYKPRFDFYGVAAQHFVKRGPYFAERAKDKALATAR